MPRLDSLRRPAELHGRANFALAASKRLSRSPVLERFPQLLGAIECSEISNALVGRLANSKPEGSILWPDFIRSLTGASPAG